MRFLLHPIALLILLLGLLFILVRALRLSSPPYPPSSSIFLIPYPHHNDA